MPTSSSPRVKAQIVVEAICNDRGRDVHVAEIAGRRIAGAGEGTELPKGPMRQRRRVMRIVVHHHQTADIVRCRFYGESATADDVCVALLANPALEALQLEQAREALVGRARRPLAVGLHQGSHEFFNSFQIRRGGMPSPEASAPHASACRGERPCWWEQVQGLNSRFGEPLSRDRTPTEAAPGTASLLLRIPGAIAMA